eukprot:6188860-Pleurochrysis_carterae.AAC.2
MRWGERSCGGRRALSGTRSMGFPLLRWRMLVAIDCFDRSECVKFSRLAWSRGVTLAWRGARGQLALLLEGCRQERTAT